MFQSTLPRRERLVPEFVLNKIITVSIHAPAKGATYHRQQGQRCDHVSIHAPAKGATNPAGLSNLKRNRFNPRSREGSDRLHSKLLHINELLLRIRESFSNTVKEQILTFINLYISIK